jgi:Concanavalin A-like lectin/glucanases superfamily/Putative Ig domain
MRLSPVTPVCQDCEFKSVERFMSRNNWFPACCLLLLLAAVRACVAQSAWVHYNANHVLVYSNDDLGNHIPDFSYAGYMGGGVALPTNVPVQETISPISGDNTANIQDAINAVSALTPGVNGFRGAVLLEPGTYEVDGSLALSQSGVVLRGSGSSTTGTILHFVGDARQTISMQGSGSVSAVGGSYPITDAYVPLGATSFHVSGGAITWGASVTISGDSDVFTDGTLLYAYDWAGNDTTINGIAFTGTTSANPGNVTLSGIGHNYTNYSSSSTPFSNLSAAYQSILAGGEYNSGPDTATVTLNNLTAGHVYAVQVWVSDPRGGGTAGRTETVSSSNVVTLAYNVPPQTGGVGQYVIGVFTATSASQSFSLTVTNSSGSTQLNALLVSDVTTTGYQPANPPPATAPFAVGDRVVVQRPVTQSWIDAIGMSNYWTPNSGLKFERTITAINGDQITIGIPLFNPIDQQWGTGEVYQVADAGRITNSAIEDLRLRSDFSDASTNWGNSRALNFDNCQNCWIQNVVVDNFYNGINSGGGAKWCTVQDCDFVSNTVPTTSAGGAAYGGSGQMILWQRCDSSDSTIYHVFVTQAAVPGPNVFLNFNSSGTSYDAGAHQRWAAGVLFDNDTLASLTGSNTGIKLENRGGDGSGQGYAAGYSIIYNGNSLGIINEIPQVPYTYNWAIGGAPGSTFIHRSDDGIFDATNGYVNPRSLYLEQLRERLGGAAVENIGYPLFTISTTPSSQGIIAGGVATFTVNGGDPTLMSNIVALSVGGLPAGMSASFSSNFVTGSGTVTLRIATSNSIPQGNYALTIAGANAGVTHTSAVNLTVGNFSLLANPPELNVVTGSGTTCALTVATNQSFSGDITFGLSGVPANASAYFSPASLAGTGSSTLVVATATNTPPGDYPLIIYGTNGDNVASTGVTLHVTRSLVAWLTFDDGMADDSSGYGNNGVLVGGASIVADPQRGNVLSLDGSSGYVDLGNAASLDLSSNSQATIAAWVKVAVTHNHNTILSKGEWNQAYSLLVKGDTTPPNLLWTGNPTSVFSADPVPLGLWTHVAVTLNGSLTTFYINGQIDGATNQDRGNPIDQTTNDVCIGREQYSGDLPAGRWFFNGEMDDVRIYNVALTESQIQQIMSSAPPSFSGNPLTLPAANAGKSYSGSLVGDASDPNPADFLTFTKVSGPAWLRVAADGGLSGIPGQADAGTNSFVVRATDLGGFSDETTLQLAVVPAPPQIADVTPSGGKLIFSGSNGVPTWPYYVLTSTNLMLPPTAWTVIATNVFDGNGSFIFTNSLNLNVTQCFYRLQLQ